MLTVEHRRRFWGVFAAVTAAIAWVALSGRWPACRLEEALGLPCIGCGGTRAARALLTGHVAEALQQNPLVVLIAVASPVCAVSDCAERTPGFVRWLRRGVEWSVFAGAVALFFVRLAKLRGVM